MGKMILAVDIGASKTDMGVYQEGSSPDKPVVEATVPTKSFHNTTELLGEFISSLEYPIDMACIGVPGPVFDNQSITTNLPWFVEAAEISEILKINRVELINDLEAAAAAVPLLKEADLYTLNTGVNRVGGNVAVLSPGSGLGEGFLTVDGNNGGFIAHASEGGHTDFAPTNQMQIALLDYLMEKLGHVSYEQVCSAQGIVNIYDFISNASGVEDPEWFTELLEEADDPSRVIIECGLDQEKVCEICRETLDMFVGILGSESGNLAIKVLATGGVYIGGGITPRITRILDSSLFLKGFLNKGRVSKLLTSIPVHVIMNMKAPMMGAASIALSWK